jgi:hypothetical protein
MSEDSVSYRQGRHIVARKNTPDLLRFAASVIRDVAPDDYNRALSDELEGRANGTVSIGHCDSCHREVTWQGSRSLCLECRDADPETAQRKDRE